MTSGGMRAGHYGSDGAKIEIFSGPVADSLRDDGYETYEIAWDGDRGWATDSFGHGYTNIMCAYNEVVRWITANLADNADIVGATGNSGGSMQIGYGLALYGLEDILDFVVLTGWPPTTGLVMRCFEGTIPDPPVKQSGLVRTLTDYVMGWLDDGDYCQWGFGPQWAEEAVGSASIVNSIPNAPKDCDYHGTNVAFIEGELDVAGVASGRIYFDTIASKNLGR